MISVSLSIEETDGRIKIVQSRIADGSATSTETEILRGIETVLAETRREIVDALTDFIPVDFIQPERLRDSQ